MRNLIASLQTWDAATHIILYDIGMDVEQVRHSGMGCCNGVVKHPAAVSPWCHLIAARFLYPTAFGKPNLLRRNRAHTSRSHYATNASQSTMHQRKPQHYDRSLLQHYATNRLRQCRTWDVEQIISTNCRNGMAA